DLLKNYISTKSDLQDHEVLEFIDDGYSGTTFNRPALNNLLQLIGKTIDVVIVKDFSRLGRNLVEVGNYIDQIFPFLGVRFIAVNENYDSNDYKGSTASIDVGLKALIYEMYSRDISQKIRAVQNTKFRRGEYVCSFPPYGYMHSKTEKNKLVQNPETAPIIKRIFELACEGNKPAQIAVIFNTECIPSPYMYHKAKGTDKMRGWRLSSEDGIWLTATIHRYITDERYTGKQVSGRRTKIDINTKKTMKIPRSQWITCENAHEPIVSKEMWEQAQKVVKAYVCKSATTDTYNLFKGILKCEHCGRTLTFFKSLKKPCYRCCKRRYVVFCECKDVRIDEGELKKYVLSEIQQKVKLSVCEGALENKFKNSNGFQDRIGNVEKQLKQLDVQKTQLFEKLVDGKLSKEAFQKTSAEITGRKKAFESEMTTMVKKLNSTYQTENNFIKDLGKYDQIEELTEAMVAELIQVIKVFPDNSLEIVWNFKDEIKNTNL
ncbi:MAG: recombinase family protein, partial [Anaerotignaceae bacterium]